jgi:hypothetical protein
LPEASFKVARVQQLIFLLFLFKKVKIKDFLKNSNAFQVNIEAI